MNCSHSTCREVPDDGSIDKALKSEVPTTLASFTC